MDKKNWKHCIGMIVMAALLLGALSACRLNPWEREEDMVAHGGVWYDDNGNGVWDENESAASGFEVELCDADGNVLDRATVNMGEYFFFREDSNLPDGQYFIRFVIPEGYAGVQAFGPTEVQVNPLTGESEQFLLSGGADRLPTEVNLGLVRIGAAGAGSTEEPVAPENEAITYTEALIIADTVVSSNGGGANFGEAPMLWVDEFSWIYLRFMIEPLPENSQFVSAMLELALGAQDNAAGKSLTFAMPEMKDTWQEMSLTWDTLIPMLPNAPTQQYEMTPYSGGVTRESYDLTSLYYKYMGYFPEAHSFEVIISLTDPQPGVSRAWSSREGAEPPKFMIGIESDY